MSDERNDTGSLLGRDSEFSGKLSFFGTVRIEGKFDGEILSDDTLVVASGGEVRGRLDVGTLIVTGGLVEAEVNARTCVELHPPGRLTGRVNTPSFQIERGALFQGQCVMPEDDQAAEPEPDEDAEPTESS
jgi:cytoskeletal protein CcmA (bactofilin family)